MSDLREKLLKLTLLRYQRMPELGQRLHSNDGHLAAILQCHLFVESLLEELIRLCLGSNTDAVLSARLSFDQKLTIAAKLKLEKDLPLLQDYVVGSIRKFNSLRNKLAHRYGQEVSSDDVRELFVGCEQDLPYQDVLEHGISIGIKRYAAFIFGNMLPKYESTAET